MFEDQVLLFGQIFSNTNKQQEIYYKFLDKAKDFGYKILIADSSSFDDLFDYKKYSDYYLFDKENRLFERDSFDNIEYFYSDFSNYRIVFNCKYVGEHELNILYTMSKVFNMARSLNFKYILRLECDCDLKEEDIKNIKENIETCILNDKKGFFVFIRDDLNGSFIKFYVSFWNIEWFLEKIGKITNIEEWNNFINKYDIKKYLSIEKVFAEFYLKHQENLMIYDKELKSHYLKTYRFKETQKFCKKDVIIDFFKDKNDNIFFISTNNGLDEFPNKVLLEQHFYDGEVLYNTIPDVGNILHWVFIEKNCEFLKLTVEENEYIITREEIDKINNFVEFYN